MIRSGDDHNDGALCITANRYGEKQRLNKKHELGNTLELELESEMDLGLG
jgi:hypothetical protein